MSETLAPPADPRHHLSTSSFEPLPPAVEMNLVHRASRVFKDLRRRRVFKVAGAYLAMAFILLQVAEIVLPALGRDRILTIAVIVAIVGFPVTVILAWLYDLSPMGVIRTTRMEDEAGPAGADPPPPDRRTIAVLPFEQVGGDAEDRYFSDGIHEDVLTSLSKVSGLRVISRNAVLRYREASLDPRRLGRELGVGTILEGSVRRAHGQVRIAARLVDVASERNVWAETYDRSLDDIFEIQRDVALHIVRALRAELSDEEEARLAATPTDDLEAYDLYLRGRFLWNERTERSLETAVEPLELATRRDPAFALAHAGLADVHLTQALYNLAAPDTVMPRALAAAERALELDPGLGEARAARGCVRALYQWDWDGALADLESASALRPSYATAHQWRAIHVLAPRAEFGPAHQALDRALELDPGSAPIHATAVFLLYLERRFDEAEEAVRRLLEETPSFALAHQFLGQILHQKEAPDEALAALERASELRGGTPEVRAAMAPALVAAGRKGEALRLRDELTTLGAGAYISETRMVRIEMALGDRSAALEHLEAAVEARATDLVWVRSEPELDPLRGEPRFEAVLGRMGLVADSRPTAPL